MFEILSVCNGGGYRYCRTNPPHPNRNAKGLYPLHRVLMENKLGRLLGRHEDVHHVNEVKTDDVIDNLEVRTKSDHAKHHHAELPRVTCQCPCGKTIWLRPRVHRQRLKRSKSGQIFCSLRCSRSCQITGGQVLILGS